MATSTRRQVSPCLGTIMDERNMRRSEFVEGTRIALADGQRWSFPPRPTGQDDPEYDGLLRTIFEAEDDPERLRGRSL